MILFLKESFKVREKLQEQYNELLYIFTSVYQWFTFCYICMCSMYVCMFVYIHNFFWTICTLVISLSSKYLSIYFLKTRTLSYITNIIIKIKKFNINIILLFSSQSPLLFCCCCFKCPLDLFRFFFPSPETNLR